MHLAEGHFRQLLIEDLQVEKFLGLIHRAIWFPGDFDPSLDPNNNISVGTSSHDPPSGQEREDLASLLDIVFSVLQEVSSHPLFPSRYPHDSSLTSTLSSWLGSQRPDFQLMSCSILRNLARSEENYAKAMVSEPLRIHHALITLLSNDLTVKRCHKAAFDVLLQLARPAENRLVIGQDSFVWMAVLRREEEDSDLQYACLTVLREVLRDCLTAVQNLLISDFRTAPEALEHEEDPHTYLSLILSLYMRR